MSGFKYKVYIHESKDKGLGIFTREFIPKGSLVWTLTDDNHLAFEKTDFIKHISKITDIPHKQYTLNHIYVWKNKAILCLDNAELINHSSNPNLCEKSSDEKKGCWAVRDIQPNEELLDAYDKYETPEWYLLLCKEGQVESSKDVSEKYT